MVDREKQKEENRKAFPVTSEIFDLFKAAGFETVKVIKTSEKRNG